MPELPEVRAHAERLHRDLTGIALAKFVPISFTALKTATPPPDKAVGQSLVGVRQRGKHLLLDFGVVTFVVHLMQGGRLRPDEKKAPRPRNGIARWEFADGQALLFTEAGNEKRAGVWVVDGEPEATEPLDHLGPDADTVSADQLLMLLHQNSGRVHGFLRDQHVIAGIGRRLANEICHHARLSPFANTAKMDADDAQGIIDALQGCVAEGLEFERARDDMSASKERPGSVHHRKGEPCPVCGDKVRTVEYKSYEVAYCPTCQTDGRILADNTTSKFLK